MEEQKKSKKGLPLKTKLLIAQSLVIVLLIIVGTVYYRQTASTLATAKNNNEKVENLQSEIDRCKSLLSSQSGNFNEYEYCRLLIEKFE